MRAAVVVVCMVTWLGCFPPPPRVAQPQPQPQPQPEAVSPQPQPQAVSPQPQPPPPPPQPQPQPANPYGPPPVYAYPYPQPPPPSPYPPPRSHFHDGEVITDFAVVGGLASIDLLTRHDLDNSGADTLVLLAGIAGGGAGGYLLTEKYDVDPGSAHATSLGLLLGVANGALLVEPTGAKHADTVLGLLLVGSAVGATGGFVYGQAASLTSGQATFVGNMTLLGTATAALAAITGSRDGEFGGFEDGTLAIGLDGGAVLGAVIAPSLDWSPYRAKVVFSATMLGALVGGFAAGLIDDPKNDSSDRNGDLVTASMTAGLWGGFALGIVMTHDAPPDPVFAPRARKPAAAGSQTTLVPWIGRERTVGVMTGGSF